MSTLFEPIIEKFLKKIEKDADFFSYYNVPIGDAIQLAKEQATNYLYEAIEKLTDGCTPDVDFFDYDEDSAEFNLDITKKEQGLITDLMRQVYFERDFALLKAFKISMTPSDLNQFSPASERKTFTDMVKMIQQDNEVKISKYASVDRLTGKKKTINYSLSQEV
ncbi:hypothetical protein [Clostridium sp. HBUAS56010]|uniref:hypothetical protein n=1 Tax=Clostridium sp. HBUAS56010 TaxID=2571127 RepID=UPI001178927E|nr:hypothetical protein [Clostridium sp. HBUAS56010]